jgi:galactokinase
MTEALDRGDIDGFLAGINASGKSSFEYLQNVYSPRHPDEQGVALALALVEEFLAGTGAYRVHGGGFAGTILVFVPSDRSAEFRDAMIPYFGADAVTPLRIRSLPAGGIS